MGCNIRNMYDIWKYERYGGLKIVKIEIITAGEVVEIAFEEEKFCKRRVWRCVLGIWR